MRKSVVEPPDAVPDAEDRARPLPDRTWRVRDIMVVWETGIVGLTARSPREETEAVDRSMNDVHTNNHIGFISMRITATVPDELGNAVKEQTDNVSAFVAEALQEKLERLHRRAARKRLLDLAGSGGVDASIDQALHRERQSSGRSSDDR